MKQRKLILLLVVILILCTACTINKYEVTLFGKEEPITLYFELCIYNEESHMVFCWNDNVGSEFPDYQLAGVETFKEK